MYAKYPEYNPIFHDKAAEIAYELVLNTSKSLRSILAQYEIKEKSDTIIQTYDATSHQTISEEVTAIKSLGGKYVGEISVLGPENKTRPAGCVVSPVSAEAAVYLKVSKEVALEQEEKAKANLAKAQDIVCRQQTIMNVAGWREKVKPEVQEQEEKKLRDAESEAALIEEQIRELEKLRIEA
jgi:valyl-tRNA synthetase